MNKSYLRICGYESKQEVTFDIITDWIQNNRVKNVEGYLSSIATMKHYDIDYDFTNNSYILPDELMTLITLTSTVSE